MSETNWKSVVVAPDATHHLFDGLPLYSRRFREVLKFHAPGLAPACDQSGAYHIDLRGEPAYAARFDRTFGFYDALAAVDTGQGWGHIHPDGSPLGPFSWAWCGNFQEGRCPVQTPEGTFIHIDREGARVGSTQWTYAGDYRDGIAVVQRADGLHSHIDKAGNLLHDRWFVDLDVFHKGYARARDTFGWTHIDRAGKPAYHQRYQAVEPFYNGRARVEGEAGALLIIDEHGQVCLHLRNCAEAQSPPDPASLAPSPALAPSRSRSSGAEAEARAELVRIAHLLYSRGYNVAIDGNLSYRLDDGNLLLTPTCLHLGFLRPEDLIVVDPEGVLLRGNRGPTSEIRLHLAAHRARPDCRAVVHAHAPHVIAASLAGIDMMKTYISTAPIPTTAYARISSEASAQVLEPYFRDFQWAILPRHGAVAWAETLWDAFLRIEGMEQCARVLMAAQAAGPLVPMSPEQRLELLRVWGLERLA